MKVVLVNPPFHVDTATGRIKKIGRLAVSVPYGLVSLAATVRKRGHTVTIIDGYAEDIDITSLVNRLKYLKPELVGFTSVTPSYPIVREIAKQFKRTAKNSVTVLGGEHATVLPETVLKMDSQFDFVVVGEGELTLNELIEKIENSGDLSSVNGLVYKKKNVKIVKNPQREFIKNLDDLPMPAYDLLKMNLYRVNRVYCDKAPAFNITTSRGCPFPCSFCSLNVMGKIRRIRSHKKVCDELEFLQKHYGAKHIFFWDPQFPISKKEGMEFCREITERGIHKLLQWTTECRVNCFDDELAHTMAESGCSMVGFGLESGSNEVLGRIKKGFNLEQVRNAVKACKKNGIKVYASFILGFPFETTEQIQKTVKFALEIDAYLSQFNILVPYPGTPIFEEYLKATGNDLNWASFLSAVGMTDYNPVIVPKGMSYRQLKEMHRNAYRQYYFRFSYVFRHLRRMWNPKVLLDYVNAAFSFFISIKN